MATDADVSPRARALAGAVLIGATVLSIVAMAHHPTAHGSAPDQMIGALVRIGGPSRIVHAAMIATVLATWLALGEYSAWRGRDGAVRIAERLYVFGVAAMIGAALVNGFVVDALAGRALQAGPDATREASAVLPLAWAVNQALAGFGVFMLSGGVAAWSLELWRTASPLARVTAGYGLVMTTSLCLAFALGAFRLDVQGMASVVVAQGLWYALVGLLLWRGARAPRG